MEIASHLATRWTLRPEVVDFLKKYEGLPPDSALYRQRGHDVTLLTRQKRPGGSLGGATRWVLVDELEHSGVDTICNAETTYINEKGVGISVNGESRFIEADTVLIAGGLKPNLKQYDWLKERKLAPEIYSVGDPQFASHAIHTVKEAFRLAQTI